MVKQGFTILMVVFFTLFLSSVFGGSAQLSQSSVGIAGKNLKVEIADTEEKRNGGLSGRKNLLEDSGMLFVFEVPAKYSFWMKDMKFPLDLIWIDENKKIIAVSKNISPDTYPTSFSPSEPVKYVLEVNAGWTERNGVGAGNVVEF